MSRNSHRSCLVIVLACLTAAACGGGDGVVVVPVSAGFLASGTGQVANNVRLVGASVSGDVVTVEVAITGPSSNDLYSFAFDLDVSDGTAVRYVTDSAVAGTALVIGAGQGIGVAASQAGNRIVVGVTKTGGGPGSGNQVASGEEVLVRLDLQVTKTGSFSVTFEGSPSNPQNPTDDPAALDSLGAVLGVTFDTVQAQITGS